LEICRVSELHWQSNRIILIRNKKGKNLKKGQINSGKQFGEIKKNNSKIIVK
jgi:hypothetical protein